ncbi:MAG: peptidylprolyl isomerase [Oscillatoriales cyanobacterium]|uniref:Peptidyl-prolyl cis-trans isomerase n=1 Tax=Microcoleus anatoxicus PTRS2 TaxID=2705321 RepID=A0ABU8YN59_9CYAN|nr:MAG: peptidylprolyl isomerase [Oscillatoriales cyanobacterium]TAD94795.1 MAG: peptidylprolyl isomerase [Oscillatoriales cyanobacterium]TAE02405.1 MAG: peptidylprolyl isomerase [Oscillatoriales cyanobacterium]TAF03910.1 MAG: peptidylprolyl isomerase [Oscillatoriales cyanobacterium]TAF37872.1 MAG: peptidylprolyl isomerase [Oscillatoriales cyanobacterium]
MQIRIQQWFFSILIIGAIFVGGCGSSTPANSTPTPNPASGETISLSPSASPAVVAASSQFSNLPRLEGKATVVMTVKGAPITIELDGTNAPITAGNFVDLVQKGVYDGLVFHRVVREPQPFVVQGGDPQGKDPKFPSERLGTGGFIDPKTSQERYIPLEIKAKGAKTPTYSTTFEQARVTEKPVLVHSRGAVAMARSNAPDSASSQFYFTLTDVPFLDGSYAVFGYVKQGMDVVDKIQAGDRIDKATVTQGLENFKAVS